MTKEECTRFTMRLPIKLRMKLKDEANAMGVSVNARILSILWDWVKANTVSEEEKCASK